MKTVKKGKTYEIMFEDEIPKLKKEWLLKRDEILYAWGLKWQQLATKLITLNEIVDTGRLRGSLTFSTEKTLGNSINRVPENIDDDFIDSKEPKTLIIGSNVPYAAKQEFKNPKGPFMRPAVLDFRDSYKILAEEIMKE